MTTIESTTDVRSSAFAKNREDMLAEIAALRALESRARREEESKRERYEKRGQILPRERVRRMLDRGSPWLELSTLCGYKQHDDRDGSLAGGNVISGLGYVSGVRAIVSATNYVIKGGTTTPFGVAKMQRMQEIAMKQKLPLVSMIESGGANLLYQSEMFIPGGKSFATQARLSAAGIPQVTVVHGSSTAGGAYIPGLSDYVIMVKDRAKVFLAGPPLLLAATGEVATEEDLGGAEMHAVIAGTTELVAADDADAIRLAREVVANLDWRPVPAALAAAPRPPRHDIEELCGVVPVDYRKPYDCREIIARIVDDSDFLELKPDHDAQTVCGRARIGGMQVGIIGNNGPITVNGATKATHFIQLACQSNIPLVYLMNTTGYMVGTRSEQSGIVKHGSKMIQAVANATVPQVTIVVGGSFGAGNYGMCGRGMGPSFIFAWPNSRTAVMGGEQAAKVLDVITRQKAKREGRTLTSDEEGMLEVQGKMIVERFGEEGHSFMASARLFDDGIIDPRDTRKVLELVLSVCAEGRARQLSPSTFGVARP
ncbi:MAG: acyl-CoA carboxylase subunit beta [Labilithrix sp.]|nr:acyl-CoA carboxylase subunit beta [Labilithrix sp.]